MIPNLKNKKFSFSAKNASNSNCWVEKIIEYMNNNFSTFFYAGTKGQDIILEESVFSNWIIEYYKSKKVKYIISKKENYVIIPIEKLHDYFSIRATYRIKKSGSSKPSKKYISDIAEYMLNNENIIIQQDNKGNLLLENNAKLNEYRFIIGTFEFFISENKNKQHQIRQLSNTYHSNVIFTIILWKEQDKNDLLAFENSL